MSRGFDARVAAQGLTLGGYQRGRDSTHVAIPLAIDDAATADEAINRAKLAMVDVSELVERLPGVRWVTSPAEASYALLANLVNALGGLDDAERAHVLALAPGLAELRQLLRLWVVELNDGRLVVATGPGMVTAPDGELYRPREASLEDLGRLD